MANKTQNNEGQGIYVHLLSPEPPELFNLIAFYFSHKLQNQELEPPGLRRFSQSEDVPPEIRGKDLVSLLVGDHCYVWGYAPSSKILEHRKIVQGHFEFNPLYGSSGVSFQVDQNEDNLTETVEKEIQRDQRTLYRTVVDFIRHRHKWRKHI